MRKLLPIVSCLFLVHARFCPDGRCRWCAAPYGRPCALCRTRRLHHNVVSVTVEGSAYRIAVDFKALVGLASAMDPGVKLDITPLAVLAKPLPDGNWEVSSDSLAGRILRVRWAAGPSIDELVGRGRQVQRHIRSGIGDFPQHVGVAGRHDDGFEGRHPGSRCQHRPRHVCPDRRPFGRRRRGFHPERGVHQFRRERAGRGSVERCEPPVLGEGCDPVDRCERPGLPHQSPARPAGLRCRQCRQGQDHGQPGRAEDSCFWLPCRCGTGSTVPIASATITTETPVGSFGAKAIAIGFGMDGAVANGTITYRLSGNGHDRAGAARSGLEQAAAADRIRPERQRRRLRSRRHGAQADRCAGSQSRAAGAGRGDSGDRRRVHGQAAESGDLAQHGERRRHRGRCRRRSDLRRRHARGQRGVRGRRLRQCHRDREAGRQRAARIR